MFLPIIKGQPRKHKPIVSKVYALDGDSFLVDVSLPKSPYNSVKMVVYFDIINLVGNT